MEFVIFFLLYLMYFIILYTRYLYIYYLWFRPWFWYITRYGIINFGLIKICIEDNLLKKPSAANLMHHSTCKCVCVCVRWANYRRSFRMHFVATCKSRWRQACGLVIYETWARTHTYIQLDAWLDTPVLQIINVHVSFDFNWLLLYSSCCSCCLSL